MLHVTVVDNFEDLCLQVLEGFYTIVQGELFELMLSDDQLAPFQNLFARGSTQFQLPKVVESQIWKAGSAGIAAEQKMNLTRIICKELLN